MVQHAGNKAIGTAARTLSCVASCHQPLLHPSSSSSSSLPLLSFLLALQQQMVQVTKHREGLAAARLVTSSP